ncbi:MAG: DUF4333 domain-containing protein [Actinobacteria bacterium]|nr:DUF4333 domain-containing protein [Actinomycetota bacterium]
MRARLLRAAILLGSAVTAGSGCGGSTSDSEEPTAAPEKLVDTQEVEQLLVNTQRRASPDFEVGAASCPAQVVVAEGVTFECTVVVEGVVAPYVVTMADVNPRNQTGRYDLRPAKAILSVPRLVDFVKRLATEPDAQVDCGPERVRIADVGSTFECQLTDSEGPHTVSLKVDDIKGKVTIVGVV